MPVFSASPYNPNPITKFIATFILGLTVVHKVHPYFEWLIVATLVIFFFLNGLKKEAILNLIIFSFLFHFPRMTQLSELGPLLKTILSLAFVIRMFILPFMAAKFMIKTSDVGTILSSMDKLRVPKTFSIPIAVMFRFFPSYKEEKKNIKLAMKIRDISFKNPLKYIEYVIVPLLIISSNVSDNIAKAAETKAIENPAKKTRYIAVRIKAIDFIFLILITSFVVGGLIC